MKEKLILITLGILYVINGILYIHEGEILWGLVIFTLSGVYFSGIERVYGSEVEHTKAHILTGGIFSAFLTVFLVIEKLVSYLSKPEKFVIPDVILIILFLPSILFSINAKKYFS